MMGQSLIASGAYAQLRCSRGSLMRLELAIQTGDQQANLTQVSDGRHLWIHRRFVGDESLVHVDLREIELVLKAEGRSWSSAASPSLLAVGGLPRLLHQIHENFTLDDKFLRAAKLGEIHVWTARGDWRPGALQTWPAPAQRDRTGMAARRLGELPPHIPHAVQVSLGQDNLFPYQIVFLRQAAASKDAASAADSVPMLTLELFDVSLGNELDPRQFDYRPGRESHVQDRTEEFLRGLGVKDPQAQAGRSSLSPVRR
jgi:hypothetical protein